MCDIKLLPRLSKYMYLTRHFLANEDVTGCSVHKIRVPDVNVILQSLFWCTSEEHQHGDSIQGSVNTTKIIFCYYGHIH